MHIKHNMKRIFTDCSQYRSRKIEKEKREKLGYKEKKIRNFLIRAKKSIFLV